MPVQEPPDPEPDPAHAAALVTLRRFRGWSSADLAAAARVAPCTISRYENGKLPLDEERLLFLAGLMGYAPETVRLAILVARRLTAQGEEPAHPLAPGVDEQRKLAASALTFLLALEPEIQRALKIGWTRRKAEEDRLRAAALVDELERCALEERPARVERDRDCRFWAMVPELGERSVRSLGHSVEEAEEWAALARLAAEHAEVPEAWRPRLRACALFFTANVERVGNRLRESDATFAGAWPVWRENPAEGLPLAEWRYLNLEASLRNDQRRGEEAVELVQRSIALAPPEAAPRLQLKLGHFFNAMGEPSRALEVLQAARAAILADGNCRLCWILNSELAVSLLDLGHAAEAAPFAAEALRLAKEGKGQLDILRNEWVAAQVAAALGHLGRALLAFAEVRQGFTKLRLAVDAALAGLDEALVLLQEGAHEEVRELAGDLFRVFRSEQLKGEPLAALKVFYDAAQQGRATTELVRQTTRSLQAAARTPSRALAD